MKAPAPPRPLALLLLLSGCAISHWTQAGGRYAPDSRQFTVELPQGWMRIRGGGELLTTRDGLQLQQIFTLVTRFHEQAKEGKTITKGMLPEEAAEIIADRVVTQGLPRGTALLENSPATLSGQPAFKLAYRYKTEDGLTMRSLLYGLVGEDALYLVGYTAPERYYYDLDLPTFESVRASFRITKAPATEAR
jgi:PsbP